MRIAIEAQRIFRPNKHGMDFVALESIRELQRIDKKMNTSSLSVREKIAVYMNQTMFTSSS